MTTLETKLSARIKQGPLHEPAFVEWVVEQVEKMESQLQKSSRDQAIDSRTYFEKESEQLQELELNSVSEMLIDLNGVEKQMDQLGCELNELSVAIHQHFIQKSKSLETVVEEYADVMNMLPQLELVLRMNDSLSLVDATRKMKLTRIKIRAERERKCSYDYIHNALQRNI